MDKIYAAFVKAQAGFAPALKNSTNPAFRSKYVDLAACVEAVIDALNANDIALIQKTHPDEKGVTVETVFVHASGESISGGTFHVPALKQDPQGYGSALTYARRYSLMAACGIAPEDDDGNAASKKPAAPVARKAEEGAPPELIEQANAAALRGLEAYQAFFTGLSKEKRQQLLPKHNGFKAIAQEVDEQKSGVTA